MSPEGGDQSLVRSYVQVWPRASFVCLMLLRPQVKKIFISRFPREDKEKYFTFKSRNLDGVALEMDDMARYGEHLRSEAPRGVSSEDEPPGCIEHG